MSDLKPCPFCGHVAMMVSIDAEFRAQCSHCSGRTGLCDSPSVALWFWNTRADSAALAAAVQAEREELIAMCRRLRKEADKGRLITLGGIIGLIEDRMSGGNPIFNVMDDSRPAPAVDVLKLVYMLIETLDHADGSALHEVFCNGVHAENGSCEGDVRTRELIDKIRALVSPTTGEGKRCTCDYDHVNDDEHRPWCGGPKPEAKDGGAR